MRDTLNEIFDFMSYIDSKASFEFFHLIFGGSVPSWTDKREYHNHFWDKYKKLKCAEIFFTALDKGNQRIIAYHYGKCKAEQVDDVLRRLYSYFPPYRLDDIRSNLSATHKSFTDTWHSLTDDEKDRFSELYVSLCCQ